MKGKICVIVLVILMFVPITVVATVYQQESSTLTKYEVEEKIEDSWTIDYIHCQQWSLDGTFVNITDTSGNKRGFGEWWSSGIRGKPIVPGERVKLTSYVYYSISKWAGNDYFNYWGPCSYETVYFDIYKGNETYLKEKVYSQSNGEAFIWITFVDAGYYHYKIYTEWEKNNKQNEIEDHYFQIPTPTPTPSIPAFEITLAIAGLLAVAYILRRKG